MINLKELAKFLVLAKKSTYAAGDQAKSTKESDGSTTLLFPMVTGNIMIIILAANRLAEEKWYFLNKFQFILWLITEA